jgi:hypothetical protein
LIVDGSYVDRSMSDEQAESTFLPGYGHHHAHEAPHEGFNLNYAEMSLYSVVDPYFDLFAVLHISAEHVHLEEAYWVTRKLPVGFQLKAGKFLSGFGRTNELHTHYWDFADPPLINKALFGDEGLNEVGTRLTWVAPTEFYLLLGGEVLMGENEASFGRTGFERPQDGLHVAPVKGPGLFVGYVESSMDIGDAAVLASVSGAYGNTRRDEDFSAGLAGGSAVTARTTVLGADLTVKYLLDAIRYISFHSEYIWRHTDGTIYSNDNVLPVSQASLEKRQSGLYAQAVMKFDLRVRGGIRIDYLNLNQVEEAGIRSALPEGLPRYTCMMEYNPTEFSRIRLQYTFDRSRSNNVKNPADRVAIHEVNLQVNLAIGAHGAHSF